MSDNEIESKMDSIIAESKFKNRNFYGAIFMFVIVIMITISLFFFEIPESNNDVIKMIIGVLVGSLSPVVFSIIGRDPNEIEKKNNKIADLEARNDELQGRVKALEDGLRELQGEIIKAQFANR